MDNEQEIDERVPCPEGACTGLIGEDGRCGTCGRVGEAAAPRAAATPPEAAAASVLAAPSAPEAAVRGIVDDPDERVPCDDGMCTGVVGPDGRCGVCGRRAEAALCGEGSDGE